MWKTSLEKVHLGQPFDKAWSPSDRREIRKKRGEPLGYLLSNCGRRVGDPTICGRGSERCPPGLPPIRLRPAAEAVCSVTLDTGLHWAEFLEVVAGKPGEGVNAGTPGVVKSGLRQELSGQSWSLSPDWTGQKVWHTHPCR